MIRWDEIQNLLVISKFHNILKKWFGVDCYFLDDKGNLKSNKISSMSSINSFTKIYSQDESESSLTSKVFEQLKSEQLDNPNWQTSIVDSNIPYLKIISAPIFMEQEFCGMILALPFLKNDLTSKDEVHLNSHLIERGVSENDAQIALNGLNKLNDQEGDYLIELLSVMAEEIVSFNEEINKREERIQDLNSELGTKYRYHSMIGKSKEMQKIYHLLEKISNSESSVFIQGENGTGKELVAKAVHFYSPRKEQVFLAVNCSAFNENLLDSELFGHVKGAFTGALKDKRGLFEVADGGTLFLDEIGDTSLSMQVKLLRVLQEGTYLPVGGLAPKKTNVRVIAATNKNLKEMMANGDFREDLFYRINVINVTLPPLRDRKEDIPLLIDHFIDKKCKESDLALKQISKKCMERMLDYSWPGNVRELENEIERLIVLAGDGKTLMPDSLSQRILDFGPSSSSNVRGINTDGKLKAALRELEIIMIKEGLKRCNYNKSRLSKELGISRASLIMKVEKYGLDKRKKSEAA